MKVDSERHWEKSNEKARCYVSPIDKWETKEGDTHVSVNDKLRHR